MTSTLFKLMLAKLLLQVCDAAGESVQLPGSRQANGDMRDRDNIGLIQFLTLPPGVRFNNRDIQTIQLNQLGDVLFALSALNAELPSMTALSGDNQAGSEASTHSVWRGLQAYNPLSRPMLFFVIDFKTTRGIPLDVGATKASYSLVGEASGVGENGFNAFYERFLPVSHRARFSFIQPATSNIVSSIADKSVNISADLRDHFMYNSQDTNLIDSDVKGLADQAFLQEYTALKTVVSEFSNLEDLSLCTRNIDYSTGDQVHPGRHTTICWFQINSLRRLAATYGVGHIKVRTAARLFEELIDDIKRVDRPRSLFFVIQDFDAERQGNNPSRGKRDADSSTETELSTDISLVRPGVEDKESVLSQAKQPGDWNLAYQYDADFHVVFVTSAFTMAVLVLGVFATSVGLWFMDPGRDSIIYRMTSQRIKMD